MPEADLHRRPSVLICRHKQDVNPGEVLGISCARRAEVLAHPGSIQERQLDRKRRRSRSETSASNVDRAAVLVDQVLCDSEAKPQAALPSCLRTIRLPEPLEQPARGPRASSQCPCLVLDTIAFVVETFTRTTTSRRASELDGVSGQVCHPTGSALFVAEHEQAALGLMQLQDDASLLGTEIASVDRCLCDPHQVNRVADDFQFPS